MRLALAVGIAFVLAGSAWAQDTKKVLTPWQGTLIGQVDRDILNYSCSLQDGGKLRCSFIQVQLINEKDNSEQILAQLPDDPKNDPDMALILAECPKVIPALEYFVEHREINPSLLPQDVVLDDMQSMVDGDPEFVHRIAESVLRICNDPTKDSFTALFNLYGERSKITCAPIVNQYEQTFVQVSDKLWVVESAPSSECGIINTSQFSTNSDTGLLWDYTASKIVTNKNGVTSYGIACSDFDEEPQPYRWRTAPLKADCVFLK